MPGKSNRKKFSPQQKKQASPAPAKGTAPVATEVREAAARISSPPSPRPVSAAPRQAPAPAGRNLASIPGIRHKFVGKELRNIGILAVLMVIVLIVLAKVIA